MTEPTTPMGWGIQLSELWIASGQPFPVDVKDLALEVTKQRFPDPVGLVTPHGVAGIDGMLSRREKKGDWCISYDEAVGVPGRINFTLAHELGHYFCHRQRQAEFRCGQVDMLHYDSDVSRKMEKEANVFASYLLMPATDFRQQIDGQIVTLDVLSTVADRYETSFTATALKWIEITDEAAMLIVARDEFICWSYPSKAAAKARAYLAPGTPVPRSVVDRLNTSTCHSGNTSYRVQPGVWHPSLEANESTIISDQFDLAIFLVRYPDARSVDHDEAEETDAFDGMMNLASGRGWLRR
ncbi:ImmA/IrrE family metallo-endopeptidase [Burkholderia glumae]|uniref:ImmA/IrrE family metallo-endopeptidase n=1 Tax=Burkholderia glumae TaxID=337 RepID=UPI00148EC1E8|nr:ImmA/IrrE family metallo-endopeptidase [Burkholderia glumae]QJW78719.1 ImmA/IrrE family metallo-endopeptidase [Burkholderia glumae]